MDRPSVKLNAQIYEEASAWFIEFRGGDLDEAGRREFDRWVRKSPENVSAYLEVAAIWNEGPKLDPRKVWPVDTLIAEGRAGDTNVVPFESPSTEAAAPPPMSDSLGQPPRRRETPGGGSISDDIVQQPTAVEKPSDLPSETSKAPRSRWVQARIAAGLVVFTVASAGAWYAFDRSNPTYSTTVGEQRSLELADGSTVELNSKSRIRVRYSADERDIDLLEGQALFHVAKNKSRPFIVSADGTRVLAVGTQFDVYKRSEGTTVTVLEGTVAVFTPEETGTAHGTPPPQELSETPSAASEASGTAAPAPPATPIAAQRPAHGSPNFGSAEIMLSGGEQVTVTPRATQKSEHANVSAAIAWTERRIVFESATLSEVAEEFNRYNQRQLVIEEPQLYGFHISGVFSSTDPESLIKFLREQLGVEVTESDSEIRVTKR